MHSPPRLELQALQRVPCTHKCAIIHDQVSNLHSPPRVATASTLLHQNKLNVQCIVNHATVYCEPRNSVL